MTAATIRRGHVPCAITFCSGGRGARRPPALRRHPDPALVLLAALLSVSLLFVVAPGIDLWMSGLFAAPAGGFPLSGDPWLIGLRDLNRALPVWIVAGLAMSLLAHGLSAPADRRRLPRPSAVVVLLVVYAVAPLCLVQLLKNTVGRARPHDILAFGGGEVFTSAWQISEACARNCSFSSGEAASAAMLPLLAILAPRRWRWVVALALAPAAVVFSFNRIAFGSHFLSDVLVSWLLVALSAVLVARRLAPAAMRIDAAVAGRLERPVRRLGRALRSSLALGPLLRAPDGTLGALAPGRPRRRSPSRARSSSIREHSEAWLFRATSRRWFSPIPAASTPPSS